MENHLQSKKVYHHYDHTDACKNSRWTARECYEFMYSRPWQQVLDYYSDVVNGRMSLSALFPTEHRELSPQMHSVCKDGEIIEASEKSESASVSTKDRSGRWARLTFKIVLSYLGGSFEGWQKQPGLNTVQGGVHELVRPRFIINPAAEPTLWGYQIPQPLSITLLFKID
ncbi:hypothetical protein TEA_029140 [Camellia sinensis var. sinensis]|uniref:Uncharacterized protein n=1 Tax=Camellia sinensis var. sinensis TaxID=542762 RepID=A0A4S4EC19_CAMSN|nr:hypothetical protein TEA_029140 [Camellia sinensis var. sinensis]